MNQLLDRTTPPKAGLLNHIALPTYESIYLSNGIPVYLLPFGTVEVLEIQAIFRAGRVFQPGIGIANYTAANMREGTNMHSSLELAQLLDGYGAWLNHSIGEESLAFKLATISKHLAKTLPLLRDVLINPTFPEGEFLNMKERAFQKLSVNEEKTKYLADRKFKHQLYGASHPYGGHLGKEELEMITLDRLIEYKNRFINPGNFFLTVVGQFQKDEILDNLESVFGSLNPGTANHDVSPAEASEIKNNVGFHYQEKTGMQASLRLGHMGIPRKHPDYYGMLVVNTLFGGFFGSRLMKNIREEKGYTYGIYSSWASMKYGGYLSIQTEVGNEYIRPTIQEIKAEMNKLIEQGTSQDELQLVKNYLLGQSISQRETLFQIGDVLRFSIINDISFEEIDRKLNVIQQLTTGDIKRLAGKYLKPNEMVEVVVGELSTKN